MAISMSASTLFPIFLVVLVLYATPAAAFGAGNIAAISSIEGEQHPEQAHRELAS